MIIPGSIVVLLGVTAVFLLYRFYLFVGTREHFLNSRNSDWPAWCRPKEKAPEHPTEPAAEKCSAVPSYTDEAPDEDTKNNQQETNNEFYVVHRSGLFSLLHLVLEDEGLEVFFSLLHLLVLHAGMLRIELTVEQAIHAAHGHKGKDIRASRERDQQHKETDEQS
jgi:hypothetical protein